MGRSSHENLPEVVPGNFPQTVPDGSPQALTSAEAQAFYRAQIDGIEVDSPKPQGVPVGLEAAYHDQTERPVSSILWERGSISAVDRLHAGAVSSMGDSEEEEKKVEPQRIWGLRKKHFYIVIVLLVLLAAVVGAGVGGGLAAANKNSEGQSPTPTSNGGGGGTSDEVTGPPVTPTGKPYDKPLNETNPDGPFVFQGWSGQNFTGNMTKKYRKYGILELEFPVRSYVWDPNGWTCCVSFCANGTDTSGNYRCQFFRQEKASGPFGRIHTYCGGVEITKSANSCS